MTCKIQADKNQLLDSSCNFYRSLLAKVKVSSHILFPETLDLSQYGCQANREAFKFHLTGVIIHRGPTAYSGHYIAHILDKTVQNQMHHLILSTASKKNDVFTADWRVV